MAAPLVVSTRDVALVAAALAEGEVVALPTDSVYGLAARIDRPRAVATIFKMKGRPPETALPVLVGKDRQVRQVAPDWPTDAALLAARFWPGLLTLVVPAREEVGRVLGGDGRTVGVRRPKERFVRALCAVSGPLAVTSANRHGEPPCTTAAEVAATFGAPDDDETAPPGVPGPPGPYRPGYPLVIVDGGTCDGAPSTVVDCTTMPVTCLRRGAVEWDWVEGALQMPRKRNFWEPRRPGPG